MSRRTVLAVCIAASVVLHALLLIAAPHVPVLRRQAEAPRAVERIRVRLVDAPEPRPRVQAARAEPGKGADSPSLRRLMERTEDVIDLEEALERPPAQPPQIAERLVERNIERRRELAPDADALRLADTRIIEISREDMREDVAVARRLVRPSPHRVLDPDAAPLLRGPVDPQRELLLLIDPLEPGRELDIAAVAPPAELEPLAVQPIEPREELPPLPPEQDLARARTLDEIAGEMAGLEELDDLVEMRLTAYTPPGEDQGYFRLEIRPREAKDVPVLPKDVTFVVDASNSITRHKLENTIKALHVAVRRLRPEDRFNVVVFRDAASFFEPQPVYASAENRQRALAFLEGIEPRGETDLYAGVRPVMERPAREGVPGIVMVVSDGRATTGIRDARTIINAISAQNDSGNSIYAYGGGNTVNQYLLDLLAYRNRGQAYVSDDIGDIPSELPRFFGTVEDPILVDCRAQYGGLNEDAVFPKALPDFFRGQAVTVYGRFKEENHRDFAMRLLGKAGPERKDILFAKDLRDAEGGGPEIARGWAFSKIYHLIGEISRVGETPELVAQVRQLSRDYGIRTIYSE
jgi:hypothetical protein